MCQKTLSKTTKKPGILTDETKILIGHLPNTNYKRHQLVQLHVTRRTNSSTKLAIFTILRVKYILKIYDGRPWTVLIGLRKGTKSGLFLEWVIKFRASQKRGNFLTRRRTVSLLRRTLLHGLNQSLSQVNVQQIY
jgi:hypothetical protein